MSSAKSPQQKRQLVILGGLGALLLLVLAFQLWPSDPTTRRASRATQETAARDGSAARRARGQTPEQAQAASGEVEQVHLERLTAKVPELEDGRRNPFTMAAEPPPPSAEKTGGPGGTGTGTAAPAAPAEPATPPGPPPPPPVAPITLKFIGTVTVPTAVGRIAAFSDGKFVYYGREGELIEGRYRIVKIGEESVQMEYADGRGRQTIRLSGK